MAYRKRRPATPLTREAGSSAIRAAHKTPSSSAWILSAWRDLALFVATPLLILPAISLAQGVWSAEGISMFVASFGAIGHHLPGMMRAYGDGALFRRFRTRFIFAPLFLGGICVLFTMKEMSGIVLVVYLWGVWHGLMQTYGFLRIYDAKKKSLAKVTRRLDFAMCLSWFTTAVVLSPTRTVTILDPFYKSGGPYLSASFISHVRAGFLAITAIVSILYLINMVLMSRRGQPPSPIKSLLFATSIGFWWYANVAVANVLVGIALFEIFHDIQYLSIVWVYNRNRVEKDAGLGQFTRFLFRRSGALIGLYVGLVFAYGSLNYVAKGQLLSGPVKEVLQGLLIASILLHFYYDGFIWKVRERSTRENLGLEGGSTSPGTAAVFPAWMAQALRWSIFIIPTAWLGMSEMRVGRPELERASALVQASPNNYEAQTNLGIALAREGKLDEAIVHYGDALRINPQYAEAHNTLGHALASQGKMDQAVPQYEEALRIKPRFAEANNNLGYALASQGKLDLATAHYDEALRIKPDFAEAHYNLGVALGSQGKADEAATHYLAALRSDPKNAGAHMNLGVLLASQGKIDEAIAHYSEAVKIVPDHPDLQVNLGLALQSKGRIDEALTHFQEALRIRPDHAEAHNDMGAALAAQGKIDEAAAHFAEAVRIDPSQARSHNNLGLALRIQSKPDEAMAHFAAAVRLQPNWYKPYENIAVLLSTHPRQTARDPAKAIEFAQKACALTGERDPGTLGTLAAAYAGARRFPEAVVAAEKAVDLATMSGRSRLAEQIRTQLQYYQQGRIPRLAP